MRKPLLLAIALVLPAAPPAHAEAWRWPVAGDVITPYRNGTDPYAAGQHRGIDIGASVEQPVVAAVGGTVRFAGTAGDYGLTVSVTTADGELITSYLHLSYKEVAKGQHVVAGDRLGAVGTSGRRSAEAPHLHFGVREAGSEHAYRNPLDFLPPSPAPPEPAPPAAPVAAPAPLSPEPVLVRRPAPAPRLAPAPRGTPAPHRRPVPAAPRIPAARPDRVRHPVPILRRAPVSHAVAERRLLSGPLRRRPPVGRARPAWQGRGAPAATRPSRSAAPVNPAPSGGPDIGLALACLGVLLAAACIGLGKSPHGERHRGRSVLSRAGLLPRRG